MIDGVQDQDLSTLTAELVELKDVVKVLSER